jgi:hypothetical protein
MATGIFYAHSGWRYLVFLILIITIIKALIGLFSKGRWGSLDEWLNRLTPIVLDIQLLLGVILWILQQRWNATSPLASWEHPVTMLIAVAISHITSRRIKNIPTDADKYQTATVGYIISALVISLGVARITGVM